MIIKKAELETVCGVTSTFPQNDHPEFAFAGKSNVGKSSLINGLLNRKALARTSSQPGKTQTINFYHINDELYFVDLPGYGYAKVTQEVKAKWGKMIERYLKSSDVLKCVFLLVDILPAKNPIIIPTSVHTAAAIRSSLFERVVSSSSIFITSSVLSLSVIIHIPPYIIIVPHSRLC